VPGIWQDLELGAPQIVRLGMNRLNAAHVALLGTLRGNGSPRISPVEPCFAKGQLLVGAMAWSRKAADLRRDPRYVLHSAVTGPDNGEGELKLYGSAGFAGGEPFNESELEPLAPLDLQSLGLDLAQRAAQVALFLERHGDDLDVPLEGADRPGSPGDVIGQEQQPTGAQYPGHFTDGAALVRDRA
jgi:Pyridoxamine 5'-phosphate oxidase